MKILAFFSVFVGLLCAQSALADNGLGVTHDELVAAAIAEDFVSRRDFDGEKPDVADLATYAALSNGEFVLSAYGDPGNLHTIQIFISALTNNVSRGLSATGNVLHLVAPNHPAPLPNIAQQMPAASPSTQWVSQKFLEAWEFWPGRGNRREWRQGNILIIFEGNTPDFFFMTIVANEKAQASRGATAGSNNTGPKHTISEVQSDAEKGNVEAQHGLGEAYYFGRGTSKNYTEAVRWYGAAAEQGHSRAQLALGKPFPHASGIDIAPDDRLAWLGKAADQGNADAYHELATTQFRDPRDADMAERSFVWCTISAELGLGEGQLCLATRYHNGWGVEQNGAKAYLWATIALKNLEPGFTAMNAAFLQADFRNRLSVEVAAQAEASADEWTRKEYGVLKSQCDTNECAIWR